MPVMGLSASGLISPERCEVALDDVVLDPPARVHLHAMLSGPPANSLGIRSRGRLRLGLPRAAGSPSVGSGASARLDEAPQHRAELLGVALPQVNFVLGAVQAETDRLRSLGPVQVINQFNYKTFGHPMILVNSTLTEARPAGCFPANGQGT